MKKISHEEFVTALAKSLKAEKGIIDSRIQDFMESLQAELKKTGDVSIKDFGNFVLAKGKLTFEPEDILALEINYKYAGMEAIEIMPAYAKKLKDEDAQDDDKSSVSKKKPPASLPPKEEEGSKKEKSETSEKITASKTLKSGPDKGKVETPQKTEASKTAKTKPEKEKSKPEPEVPKTGKPEEIDDDDPFNLSGPESKASVFGDIEPEIKKEPAAPSSDEGKAAGPPAGKEEEDEKTEEAEDLAKEEKEEKEIEFTETFADEVPEAEDKPRSKAAIYALAAMAAMLLFALFIYQADFDLPFNLPGDGAATLPIVLQEEETAPQAAASHEVRQGELTSEEEAEPDETEITETAVSASTAETDPVGADGDNSVYGLYGDLSDVSRPFTIVVHSLPYRQASSERDRIRRQGYRATLHNVTLENGNETWRVGIGQFETIESAGNAIQRLEEPYSRNNFIARIRR